MFEKLLGEQSIGGGLPEEHVTFVLSPGACAKLTDYTGDTSSWTTLPVLTALRAACGGRSITRTSIVHFTVPTRSGPIPMKAQARPRRPGETEVRLFLRGEH